MDSISTFNMVISCFCYRITITQREIRRSKKLNAAPEGIRNWR
ncbi:hypothetical protein SFJ1713_2677 [Shigella flexneri SFJ17B]|nr:hypothetical protein SFJ1713_2677 [Shigella flexneri SFJ17B]